MLTLLLCAALTPAAHATATAPTATPEPGFVPKASAAEGGAVDMAVGLGHTTQVRMVGGPMAVVSGHASLALTDRLQLTGDAYLGQGAGNPDLSSAALGALGARYNIIDGDGIRLAPFVVGGRTSHLGWHDDGYYQDLNTLILPGLAAEIGSDWIVLDASLPVPLSVLYTDPDTLESYRYDQSLWEAVAWEFAAVADLGVTARFLEVHAMRIGVTSPVTPTLSWRLQPKKAYLEGHAFAGILGAGFQGRMGVAL